MRINFLRKIFWILFCLLGGYWLMNSIDQPLLPGAASLANVVKPVAVPPQNAYFALLGLDAPASENSVDWGRRVAGNLSHTPAMTSGKPVCDLESQHCLKLARQTPTVLQQALREQARLQARYVAARQLPHFVEVFDDEVTLDYSAALRAQMLRHAQMALWLESGQIAAILQELRVDMAFQRRGLVAARSLISKMVWLAALQRDYVLLADLLRAHPTHLQPYMREVQVLLQPLSVAERDMRPVLRQEFQWMAKVVRYSAHQAWFGGTSEPGWLKHLPAFVAARLFLPNATLNRCYQLEQLDEQLAQVGSREFMAQQSQVAAQQGHWLQPSWRDYYNPAGWEMLRLIRVDYRGYLRRPWEFDMWLRLLQLQVQARQQGVAERQMGAWVAVQPLRDMFQDAPVQWDERRRELYVPLAHPAMPYGRFGHGNERLALPWPEQP